MNISFKTPTSTNIVNLLHTYSSLFNKLSLNMVSLTTELKSYDIFLSNTIASNMVSLTSTDTALSVDISELKSYDTFLSNTIASNIVSLTSINTALSLDISELNSYDTFLSNTIASNIVSLTSTDTALSLDIYQSKTNFVQTASNVGTGTSIFKQKTGQTLEFKNVKTNNLSITEVNNDVVIDHTGIIGLQNNRGSSGQPSLYSRNNIYTGLEFDSYGAMFLKVNGNDNLVMTYDSGAPVGTQSAAQFYTDNIYIQDGSQTQPVLSFLNAGMSGIFRTGTSGIGFTTSGAQRLHIHNTYLEKFVQMRAENGLVDKPAISFTNDQTSGCYLANSNDIRMSVNGKDVTGFNANTFTLYKPLVSSFQPLIITISTADQPINNITQTRVYFDSYYLLQSDYITWNNTLSQFEVKDNDLANGVYLVSYHFTYAASSSGDTRAAWVVIDSYTAGFRFGHQSFRNSSRITGMTTAFIVNIPKNSKIYLSTYQDSGSSLAIRGTEGRFMSIYRMC